MRALWTIIPNGYHYDKAKWKVKPITVDREQNYLSAVFNELKRVGEWNLPNPLKVAEASGKMKVNALVDLEPDPLSARRLRALRQT